MARGGKRERSGRKAGIPNRISGTVKENVIQVFEAMGGINGMVKWAEGNQTDFYRLYGKLLPTDMHHTGAVGTYAAQPIPVEQRDSDALEGAAGPPANSHSNGSH